MTHFGNLRRIPWTPTFNWYPTVAAAAARINSFHEDYPQRVDVTAGVIKNLEPRATPRGFYPVKNGRLQLIHQMVFGDTDHAGSWRAVRVLVADHVPPSPDRVPELMTRLEESYLFTIHRMEHLIDWYNDFNAIHPFHDGNGRVGGIIVACYSHTMWPEKGWLGPDQ